MDVRKSREEVELDISQRFLGEQLAAAFGRSPSNADKSHKFLNLKAHFVHSLTSSRSSNDGESVYTGKS